MRGKYITTSLKLAVLAKPKKMMLLNVNETKAAIENFEPIWTKELLVPKHYPGKIRPVSMAKIA